SGETSRAIQVPSLVVNEIVRSARMGRESVGSRVGCWAAARAIAKSERLATNSVGRFMRYIFPMTRLARKPGAAPKRSVWQRIKDVALRDVGVVFRGGVQEGSLERLEELLLQADFGVPVTLRLVQEVERRAKRGQAKTEDDFRRVLAESIEEALTAGEADPALV